MSPLIRKIAMTVPSRMQATVNKSWQSATTACQQGVWIKWLGSMVQNTSRVVWIKLKELDALDGYIYSVCIWIISNVFFTLLANSLCTFLLILDWKDNILGFINILLVAVSEIWSWNLSDVVF